MNIFLLYVSGFILSMIIAMIMFAVMEDELSVLDVIRTIIIALFSWFSVILYIAVIIVELSGDLERLDKIILWRKK